jgi:transcriptional regulator with XRE-family HTH domain
MTSLGYDTASPLVDEEALEALLADVAAASDALSRSEDVSRDIAELISALPARLRADAPANAFAGDPYLSENAYAGAARAAAALISGVDRAPRREVRLGVEQVRQALRDILERRPLDEDVPTEQIALWLEANLELPQRQLAELVGTSPRTWQRWLTGARPDAEQAMRLRRIARITMHLRHALTGPGVGRWFTTQHPLIKNGGGSPAELLSDPEGYQRLLALAAGLRSTRAS